MPVGPTTKQRWCESGENVPAGCAWCEDIMAKTELCGGELPLNVIFVGGEWVDPIRGAWRTTPGTKKDSMRAAPPATEEHPIKGETSPQTRWGGV